ncbi:hypothetical protein [Nostoc sp. GT001]|jgi:hypothetical protein|uniref:hypothetical protein n=1 Tax=Nostoc sp. GT001 TaxID=3056647 RepID=UPI000DFB2B15|nr:hypothetical protein [Nostoc sp. GT001]MDM9580500.1 hypothetical protein [Nostoc sp. GT001]RCJ21312.1 hypothetical protein A6S26_24830 [Nostoc sp. ATCC 43529]
MNSLLRKPSYGLAKELKLNQDGYRTRSFYPEAQIALAFAFHHRSTALLQQKTYSGETQL